MQYNRYAIFFSLPYYSALYCSAFYSVTYSPHSYAQHQERNNNSGNVILENNVLLANNITLENKGTLEDNVMLASNLILASGGAFNDSVYAKQLKPTLTKVKIIIKSVGEIYVDGLLTRNSFQLLDDTVFFDFLNIHSIVKSKEITDAFKNGINHDFSCKGMRSECTILTDDFSISIDYHNNTLYLFLSPTYITDKKLDNVYLKVEGSNIISNRMTGSYYQDITNNAFYNIRNSGYTGLYNGFISHNFYNSNNDNEIIDLNYTWLNNDYKLQLGRSYELNDFNYAYSKSFYNSNKTDSLIFGTSNSMSVKRMGKNYTYLSPINGSTVVTRNDKEIFRSPTNIGINSISYSELPKGIYTASIKIISDSGAVVFQENQLIANENYTVDALDYFGQIGKLEENGELFLGAGVSLPILTNLTSSFSLYHIENALNYSASIEFKYETLFFNTEFKKSATEDEYNIRASFDMFSFSYNRLKNKTDASSSDNFFFNVSKAIDSTSIAMYSYNKSNAYTTNSAHNISINKTVSSNLLFTAGVSLSDSNLLTSLTFTLILNERVNTSQTIINSDNKFQVRASVGHNNTINDNISYRINADASTKGSNSTGAAGGVGGNIYIDQETFYANSSVYANSNSDIRASFNFDSMQIISPENVEFKNSRDFFSGNSFIIADKAFRENIDVSVQSQSEASTVFLPDHHIMEVDSYQRYFLNAFVKTGDYIFDNNSDRLQQKIDLTPGKAFFIHKSDEKIVEVITFIGEENTSYANCEENSCISIENIQNNLFKIKAFENSEAKIIADGVYCNTMYIKAFKTNQTKIERIACEN